MKTIDNYVFTGKKAIIRVDFNVPVGDDGVINSKEDCDQNHYHDGLRETQDADGGIDDRFGFTTLIVAAQTMLRESKCLDADHAQEGERDEQSPHLFPLFLKKD